MKATALVTALLETDEDDPSAFLAQNLTADNFPDTYIITAWKAFEPNTYYPNGQRKTPTQHFLGDTRGPYKLGVGAWYPFNMGYHYTVPKNADIFTHEEAKAYIKKLQADPWTANNFERFTPRPVSVAAQEVTGTRGRS